MRSIPAPSYLHALGYVSPFMWQSCSSERAGAHIYHIKTPGRIGLNQDSFNSLVLGTFNNSIRENEGAYDQRHSHEEDAVLDSASAASR